MGDRIMESPAALGFSMPAEWSAHAGCLMQWPAREDLWGDRLADAQRDYAVVARAIAAFEPVTMICGPGQAATVRHHCGSDVEPLELEIDDSWVRDNGPIFVRDERGALAVVDFGFNAWGERWHPYDHDAAVPARIAEHLGMLVFEAPFVLEGGSFFVDGEGTLLTTEQCLLNPNRNPDMTREQIEQGLRDFLGVSTIVWLPYGHSLDVGPAGTDGHVDGVAQYVAPGHILLEVTTDPASPEFDRARENLARLERGHDAGGRPFTISRLDPGPDATVSFANFYLANGGVVVPVGGTAADGPALEFIGALYPGREVVGVPGQTLLYGGGGPHCITQQIPEGKPAARR